MIVQAGCLADSGSMHLLIEAILPSLRFFRSSFDSLMRANHLSCRPCIFVYMKKVIRGRQHGWSIISKHHLYLLI